MIRTFATGTIILVALVLSCSAEIIRPGTDLAATPNTSPSLNAATRVPAIAPLVPPVPAPPQKPATPLPAAIEGPYPPPALLEISGVKQASGQGSFCWKDEQGSPLCADTFGIPTALNPLLAPRQFTARFFLLFTQPVTAVHLTVYPVTLEQQLSSNGKGLLHAMTLVWVIFMLVLFVMEPLFLKRLFKKYGEKDPVRVMAYAHRLHWVLLGASVVTIVGAMAGSHGWFFF
jgi:hypothetical protein